MTRTPPRLSAWRDAVAGRANRTCDGFPEAVRGRFARLAEALVPVVQCGLAAGLAWFVAHELVGHPSPFFAPIAAAIALGTGIGKRLRRAVELVGGVVVGVGAGDALISVIGSGPWQIALVVTIAMSAAVFLDSGAMVANQAASSAILVATLLPPGGTGGTYRMIDTAIGGGLAILAMALLPVEPLRRARREAAAILGVGSSVLGEVAGGLRERDSEAIHDALTSARGTQPAIDGVSGYVEGARELTRISPIYRRRSGEVEELERLIVPMDNAVRNIRVLARRASVAVEDDAVPRRGLVDEIERLADVTDRVGQLVQGGRDAPSAVEITRELRSVAAGARRELVEGRTLTEVVLLAQVRSVLVDLLQVAGMSSTSALATLPPTVSSPAVPPEVWEDGS